MPTPRGGHAAAVLDGKIIAAGGSGGDGTIAFANVEAYDFGSDTWLVKAPLPKGNHLYAMTVVNGQIYAIGGAGGSDVGYARFTDVYVYDPISDIWTPRSPMPTARAYLGVGVINGLIYAVGGDNNGRLAALEAYDPVADSWLPKTPMPTRRYGLGAGVIDGVLYAVGGATTSTALTTLEAYDPTTDSWTTKRPMPTPRIGVSVAVLDGILYAIGGLTDDSATGLLATVEAYDPTTDIWTECTPMPTPRSFSASVTMNGALLVTGGLGALANGLFPAIGVVEAFHALYHVCLLYDPTRAVRSGATTPIRLQLCDRGGADLSSSSITLEAISITQTSTSISGAVQESGNANPDNNFRFDPTLGSTGGYSFNLTTKGLTTGAYNLNFMVSGDSLVYRAPFQVK